MKLLYVFGLLFIQFSSLYAGMIKNIYRKEVVKRHTIYSESTNPNSPAQVGNGKFAFGVDITGLQTFVPFNTLSDWSWHSFPLPNKQSEADFKFSMLETHGKMVPYCIPNNEQAELSSWLAVNPHRFNLGRIGLQLIKSDGSIAKSNDLKNTHQVVDIWSGIIQSTFSLDGVLVTVKTGCDPKFDMIGVSVKSELIKQNRIRIFIDFPNPDTKKMSNYVGSYSSTQNTRNTTIDFSGKNSALINRDLQSLKYNIELHWTSKAKLLSNDTISSPNRFYINPEQTNEIEFTCEFSPEKSLKKNVTPERVFKRSSQSWSKFWSTGAALDLSGSKDKRWRELERRIVLSQYQMRLNEAGILPPQESGLVNNSWYGRFHFEMIWWHGVHYALWNRWTLFDNYLKIYRDFLPTSVQRANKQGYQGARWPKCTANFDREWPHMIHALLIWQQPHPIYFAELDYRLHPTTKTLDKWRNIVMETADFMADFAYYDNSTKRYILGPPIYIVSENTNPESTFNPCFELSYWQFGLRTAQLWRERLGLKRNDKWDDVLKRISPLPQKDGLYLTHENIEGMWTNFNYEHPALLGVFGMLPGDGVDTIIFKKTLDKVLNVWNFNRTWGWDFPMLAMACARSGNSEMAVEMLLHDSQNFHFDEHGLATGGPFPYFPSNGGLLTAVAMMAGGWDGSTGDAPGFPKNGNWSVKYENFNKLP